MKEPITVQLVTEQEKDLYAYTVSRFPTIFLAGKLNTWAEAERMLTPNKLVEHVAGVISHETIHIVLSNLKHDTASIKFDTIIGKATFGCEPHGLWDIKQTFKENREKWRKRRN